MLWPMFVCKSVPCKCARGKNNPTTTTSHRRNRRRCKSDSSQGPHLQNLNPSVIYVKNPPCQRFLPPSPPSSPLQCRACRAPPNQQAPKIFNHAPPTHQDGIRQKCPTDKNESPPARNRESHARSSGLSSCPPTSAGPPSFPPPPETTSQISRNGCNFDSHKLGKGRRTIPYRQYGKRQIAAAVRPITWVPMKGVTYLPYPLALGLLCRFPCFPAFSLVPETLSTAYQPIFPAPKRPNDGGCPATETNCQPKTPSLPIHDDSHSRAL